MTRNSPISALFRPQVSGKPDIDNGVPKPSNSIMPSDQQMESMEEANRQVEGRLIREMFKAK